MECLILTPAILLLHLSPSQLMPTPPFSLLRAKFLEVPDLLFLSCPTASQKISFALLLNSVLYLINSYHLYH